MSPNPACPRPNEAPSPVPIASQTVKPCDRARAGRRNSVPERTILRSVGAAETMTGLGGKNLQGLGHGPRYDERSRVDHVPLEVEDGADQRRVRRDRHRDGGGAVAGAGARGGGRDQDVGGNEQGATGRAERAEVEGERDAPPRLEGVPDNQDRARSSEGSGEEDAE